MQKSSLFLVRIFLIVATLVASCLTINQSAKADAAPGPDPTISGIGPYQPQKTKVQMLSETVLIEVNPSTLSKTIYQIGVNANFTMQNQGQTEEKMQVVFPLTNLDGNMAGSYDIIADTFVAKVNGQSVPITDITTPPDLTYSPKSGDSLSPSEDKFYGDVLWAAFDATFPIHQKVTLEVEYKMRESSRFTGIEYILETGAGWYGNILSADIILKFPYPATDEIVESANPGYTFSGNEMHWKMANLKPTRESNLYIHVVQASAWQQILESRSKLEQNPSDADGWYDLGNQYTELSIWFLFGECIYSPAYNLTSTYFADLAAQSYEKAIQLRPNWGDAHLQLANILWFGNKNVNKWFDWLNNYHQSSKIQVQPIQTGDPYVQRVLEEIDLALSYKVTDEYLACRLYSYINKAIPELKLTLPATETVTPKLPTETPVPTSTSTSIINIMPVQVPASKANSSTSIYGFVIIAIILLGIFIYFWMYRVKSKK